MSVIVPEIVIASYANPESNDQLIRLKNVADNVVTGIQSRLLSDDPCQRWSQQVLSVYLQDVLLPADLRKKYRVDHMNQILSKTVTLTLQDIQRQQEKFTAQTQSEEQYLGAKEAIFSILRHPGMLDEAFELVEQRVQEGNVNWEMVLVITTVATTTLEQYRSQSTFNVFSFLKQIIHKILSSSIVSRNSEGIVGAFVMARHCCLISPSKFDRYEKWYTGTFGGETTTPARSPEKFTFLACVLSDMLPNDPICFLQVHTIYWPFVPAGMRNVWSDYIGSAKIRIGEEQDAELELAEENLPNPNNPIQLDIDRVIKAFEAVQKVPAAITEMLMFRKRYYFDQFLPALLRKPHGKPASDVRVRLIGALHSSGKIPTALYEAYKSSEQ